MLFNAGNSIVVNYLRMIRASTLLLSKSEASWKAARNKKNNKIKAKRNRPENDTKSVKNYGQSVPSLL